MKKIISLVIAILLITALLTSCASSSSAPSGNLNKAEYDSASQEQSAPMPSAAYASVQDVKEKDTAGSVAADNGSALTSGTLSASLSGEKMIYNLSASVETTKFDETIKNVDMLINKFGAFVETANISGNSYGYTTFRSADYTIRVPVSNFKGMNDSLPVLGNIINRNTTAQNITAQFIDTQSRLDAYNTEESRLLAMLAKTATVADMITIEQRLSDVRYQIESLTSTLKNWQNQVDYSTVTIHIAEVAELTNQVSVQRTYWQQLWDGVSATFKGIGTFFKGLFMGIVIALPVLLILAVLAVIVVVIIRAANKKNKRNNKQDNNTKE